METKIKTIDEISKISEDLRNKGKRIVTTNGSFDILHAAHIRLLQESSNKGDILIVLLNSDISVKKSKGEKRPIIPEKERAKILSSLESVDYVVLFEEEKPLNLLKEIRPQIHVKGGTVIQERLNEERTLISEWSGELHQLPLEEGFATTNIINKILRLYGNA